MNRVLSRAAAVRAVLGLAAAMVLAACSADGRPLQVPQNEMAVRLEPKVGLIAFLGLDGNIYTIDQSGGTPTAITDDAFTSLAGSRAYGLPVWSPDGQRLAFGGFSGPRGQNPSQSSLYTADRDGANLVQAHTSSNYLIYYNWSPDSQRLGLISETPTRSLAMQVVPADGGPAELLDAGSPYYWSWAPDGSALLAHAGGLGNTRPHLALLSLGEQVAEYGLDIQPATFKTPAFSPDGARVLVAGHTPEGRPALLLADALGRDPQVLAEYEGSIAFAWSPDGKRVAYLVSPTPRPSDPGRLHVIDPAGQAAPIELDDDVFAFFWAPNSQQLAYFAETDMALGDEASAADAPGAPGQPLVWDLEVLAIGKGKAHWVSTVLATERFLQVIPYFDQYHQSLTIWSPDSKNLVISAYRPDGAPAIWVVAASGRLEPRYIGPGHVAFWSRQ
jgi:hypothetical protein